MGPEKKVNSKYPLLLAEDDSLLAIALTEFLEAGGYSVYHTGRCKEAIEILSENVIQVALVDKNLIDCEGTEIAEYILSEKLKTKMILMTAYGRDEKIKDFIRKGAFDFVEKPVDMAKLMKRIENANRMYIYEYSNEAERSQKRSKNEIVGKSPEIKKIKDLIHLVSRHNSSVLILGETGTGKELIAKNIHLQSDRKDKMFLSINCTSIPETLFESEFFGYEKGAFTGAQNSKKGYFEIANYGVLHLDEIGEMPLGFQAKLLRVLESGTFIKLGGTREISVDVRIVASTNKDLLQEVKRGNFREDLYFRLAVFTLAIPPLRKRSEDIPVIAEHLWKILQKELGEKSDFSSFPIEKLMSKEWKGNVRELRNYLERTMIYSDLPGRDVPAQSSTNLEENAEDEIVFLDEYVRDYVIYVLKKFDFNKTKTAEALGMSVSTLKRWIKKWGLVVTRSLNV